MAEETGGEDGANSRVKRIHTQREGGEQTHDSDRR